MEYVSISTYVETAYYHNLERRPADEFPLLICYCPCCNKGLERCEDGNGVHCYCGFEVRTREE